MEAGMEQDGEQVMPAITPTNNVNQQLHEREWQLSAAMTESKRLETIGIEQLAEIERLTAELSKVREELEFSERMEAAVYDALQATGVPCFEKVEGERRWLNSRKQIAWLGSELSRVREELAFSKSYIKGAEAQIARDEAELSRERERHQDLRQVVKEICGEHDRLSAYASCACWSCIRISALLEPKLPAPVVTPEEK